MNSDSSHPPGEHWSKQCPHKDKLEAMTDAIGEKVDKPEGAEPPRVKPGKYVPPSLRDGARRPGESMASGRRGNYCRISCDTNSCNFKGAKGYKDILSDMWILNFHIFFQFQLFCVMLNPQILPLFRRVCHNPCYQPVRRYARV